MNKENIRDEGSFFEQEDEIDLNIFFRTLLRSKKNIGITTILFTLLFTIYGGLQKKTYQGEFEIVLNTEESTSKFGNLGRSSKMIANSLKLDSPSASSLETQVGILKRPAVIKSVYDFVINERKKTNSKDKDVVFSKWKKKNLNIKLIKDTSILNIVYKDQDKKIIIPVLKSISEKYQEYSGKSKRRELELAEKFLNGQISIYRKKSEKSIKDAQTYAIEEDLVGMSGNFLTRSNMGNSSRNINDTNFSGYLNLNLMEDNISNIYNDISIRGFQNVDIENARVDAANLIKRIDYQIEKIKNLENNSSSIQYVGTIIPKSISDKNTGITSMLNKIDDQLVELKSKYTDKDVQVKQLKEKRLIAIRLLKERTIDYLKAQKLDTEALLESTTRPKDILINYNSLMREAAMDENTLISLERQLREINVVKAQVEDPWELVTKPTLNKRHIAPKKSIYFIFGSITGFLISSIIAIYKEKKAGLVYEKSLMEKILGTKVIEEIDLENNSYLVNSKEIFLKEILNTSIIPKLRFLKSNSIKNDAVDRFFEINFNNSNKFKIDNILIDIKNDEKIVLITSLNSVSYNEINKLKQRLDNLNLKLFGIVLLKY